MFTKRAGAFVSLSIFAVTLSACGQARPDEAAAAGPIDAEVQTAKRRVAAAVTDADVTVAAAPSATGCAISTNGAADPDRTLNDLRGALAEIGADVASDVASDAGATAADDARARFLGDLQILLGQIEACLPTLANGAPADDGPATGAAFADEVHQVLTDLFGALTAPITQGE